MTPRPLKSESPDFDPFLDQARQGRHDDAVRGLVDSFGGAPLHAHVQAKAVEVLGAIARMAEAAGDLGHAELALAEAARLAPRFADVRYRLACVRLTAHKRAEARRDLGAALRLNPRYIAARVELALLDAREGMLGEALETLRQLGQEVRVPEPRLYGQGLSSLEHADWEEAGMLLRHALHLEVPGIHEVIREFHARLAHGDRSGAAELVRQSLPRHEGYADLHYLLGTAELEESLLDDAVSSLARALELHPDYHAARVQMARALEALGDMAQAEEQVALVLQADAHHPQALELRERWSRLHHHRRGAGTPGAPPRGEARKAS